MLNLAQNLISVVLFLKVTKGSQKMATTKINHKNALCVFLGLRFKWQVKTPRREPKVSVFFFFLLSYEKDLQ